jgi:hypothetical protein
MPTDWTHRDSAPANVRASCETATAETRVASAGVILLAILQVFLYDFANLEGAARALSIICLDHIQAALVKGAKMLSAEGSLAVRELQQNGRATAALQSTNSN